MKARIWARAKNGRWSAELTFAMNQEHQDFVHDGRFDTTAAKTAALARAEDLFGQQFAWFITNGAERYHVEVIP